MRGELTSTATQPPPRRRTRARWILACTLALLAGVMLNYLVAWGLAWLAQVYEERAWGGASVRTTFATVPSTPTLPLEWPLAVPPDWPAQPASGWEERRAGQWNTRCTYSWPSPTEPQDLRRLVILTVDQSGWPFTGLRSVWFSDMAWAPDQTPAAIHDDRRTTLDTPWILPGCSTSTELPVGIVPIPFAINTLFYAAIVMACGLLTRRFIHARRRRAGLCPHCRYALAGLPANAPCPECGHATPSPS